MLSRELVLHPQTLSIMQCNAMLCGGVRLKPIIILVRDFQVHTQTPPTPPIANFIRTNLLHPHSSSFTLINHPLIHSHSHTIIHGICLIKLSFLLQYYFHVSCSIHAFVLSCIGAPTATEGRLSKFQASHRRRWRNWLVVIFLTPFQLSTNSLLFFFILFLLFY